MRCNSACGVVSKLFFFTSGRRHTICGRDWSSDVCSSDLSIIGAPVYGFYAHVVLRIESIIGAPVYGFYAENDMRIDATVSPTTDAMKELKKPYDPVKIGRASCRERV